LLGAVLLWPALSFLHGQTQATLVIEKGSVMARGRWSPAGSTPGEAPAGLRLVEIHCIKVGMYCIAATASVQGGEPHLAVEYYEVTRWDKKGIEAENDGFSCTNNVIKFEFRDSSVTATDSPKTTKTKSARDACQTLAHAIRYELIGESHEVASERGPAQ
jgi:hypothetical protein